MTGIPAVLPRLTRTGRSTAPRWACAGLLVVVLLAAAGCRNAENGPPPRASAKAFVQAMVAGDEPGMRAASVGDETSARELAAQARQNAAYERLSAAAAKAYGDASRVLAGRRAGDHYATRLPTIDAEPEHIFDNGTATVGEGPNTIHLKLVNGLWKVDRAMLVPPSAEGAAERIRMVDAIGTADERVAKNIESGAYASAEQARADLIRQTSQAIQSNLLPQTRSSPQTQSSP